MLTKEEWRAVFSAAAQQATKKHEDPLLTLRYATAWLEAEAMSLGTRTLAEMIMDGQTPLPNTLPEILDYITESYWPATDPLELVEWMELG